MNGLAKLCARLTAVNPVTLKELRQLVRSRIILWALFLYPILLLVVCGSILSSELRHLDDIGGPAERAYAMMTLTAGGSLANGVFGLLGLLTLFVVPIFTGIRLARETAPGRMDLQFTTALTAGDIVGGKMMGAFLMALTFTALSLPFLTLAYLMRGIDLSAIAWTALGLVACSLASTAIAVSVGAFRAPVGARVILMSLGYFAGGVMSLGVSLISILDSHMMSVSSGSWGTRLLWAAVVGVIVVFGRAWAASNLMATHTDFKRGLRRLEFVLVLAVWTVALVGTALTGDDDWTIGVGVVLVMMTVIGALSVLQPPGLARGIAAQAPRRLLSRLWRFPFATTAASGLLFALVLAGVSVAVMIGCLVLSDEASSIEKFVPGAVAVFGEVALVAVVVGTVFRLFRVRRERYASGPMVVFAIFGLLQLAGGFGIAGVISDANAIFGYFAGIEDALDAHARYGTVGLLAALTFLIVEGSRTFRRFRRPEKTETK